MINNLTVVQTIKRSSPTFAIPHYSNRILKILLAFLIPSIILLVGSFILAKPAQLPQTDAAISKDTIGPISHISENQTEVEIEPVKVKPEGVPSVLGNESSEINTDDEPVPVAEVSYRADPIYDPVGVELEQIIAGDTSAYGQKVSAEHLVQIDPNQYTKDPLELLAESGGEHLIPDVLKPPLQNNPIGQPQPVGNYQPANQAVNTVQYHYNGDGHLVGKTVDGVRTDFALDIAGDLPEVIYTSDGDSYLHLPGVIMTENPAGEVRYLLSDGLGSIRQTVDETGQVVASYEYDPYGYPVQVSGNDPYGYTGELWESEIGLLHLRKRWYLPETGRFISVDPSEGNTLNPSSLPPSYLYANGNPVNLVDPSGLSWYSPTMYEGTVIHKLIETDYVNRAYAAGREADSEVYIDAASKTKTKLEWGYTLPERVPLPDVGDLNPGRADIVDFSLRSVYEIKHYNSRVIGFADALWYRDKLDQDSLYGQLAPWRLGGPEGYPGAVHFGNWPTDPDAWLMGGYTMPGVITYWGVAKPKKVLEWCWWGVLIYATGNVATQIPGGGAPQPIPVPVR